MRITGSALKVTTISATAALHPQYDPGRAQENQQDSDRVHEKRSETTQETPTVEVGNQALGGHSASAVLII